MSRAASTVKRQRPSGFSAVCAVVIVVAGLGVLGALWELAGLIFSARLSTLFIPPTSTAGPTFVAIQHQIQKALTAASLPDVRAAACAVKLVVDGLLIYGAVRTLQLRASTRAWFLRLLVVAACMELLAMGLAVLVQVRTYAALRPLLDRWMATAVSGAPAEAKTAFSVIMSASILLGLGWTIVWSSAKIGAYLFSRHYLQKPASASLFERPSGAGVPTQQD